MNAPDLSAFGAVRLIAPLAGGHRNQVWLAERAGAQLVAKSTRRDAAQLAWLAAPQAAARAAGFVVPGLIGAANGALVSQGWTLEPFLPGATFSDADLRAIAARIGQFHRLAAPIGQRPGFVTLPELADCDRGGDIDLHLLPADLAARLRAAWRAVAGARCQCLHGDLGPQNLIHTAQGPALIDWDEARVDCLFLESGDPSPAEQAAHLAYEIASGWTSEPDYARRLAARLSPFASG